LRLSHRARSHLAGLVFGSLPTLGALGGAAWLMHAGVVDAPSLSSWGALGGFVREHPVAAIALLQLLYMAAQSLCYAFYRPAPRGPEETLPTLTVIIPAFNEGPMVRRSIDSVVRADYPREKLEILVVDDGSRDDTFFHMERARSLQPDVVRLIHFPGNRGKRAGLVAGFRAARGEIVITIDSDSEIDPGTLREMVAPFQRSARVGAVAGRVVVLNNNTFIGSMLDVSYELAFDFGRASQCAYVEVSCCPGALSAFRRALVLPVLNEWVSQRFWGRPVTHGEDQALTNLVLRQGFETVYQRHAVIRTLVPERYQQLCRMFLRWERSFIVEGFSFARFMFTRYREKNRLLPAAMFLLGNLRLLMLYLGLLVLPIKLAQHPERAPDYLIALLVGAGITALYHLRNHRGPRFVFGVLYALYSFLLLQWILPWAFVTVRDERWGTR
jgi:hyaluronan synthase